MRKKVADSKRGMRETLAIARSNKKKQDTSRYGAVLAAQVRSKQTILESRLSNIRHRFCAAAQGGGGASPESPTKKKIKAAPRPTYGPHNKDKNSKDPITRERAEMKTKSARGKDQQKTLCRRIIRGEVTES